MPSLNMASGEAAPLIEYLQFILNNKLEIHNEHTDNKGWPSMFDSRIIRFGTEGNSKINRIMRKPRRTNWDFFTRHHSDNTAYLQMSGNIRSELQLETVMKGFNRVVIDAYHASCLSKTIRNRDLVSM